MAELVYALNAVTCLVCALLLWRGYRRSRQRLLMWAALCFALLFANNVLTFVDLILVPSIDLHWVRSLVGLTGVSLLVFGLVWESP